MHQAKKKESLQQLYDLQLCGGFIDQSLLFDILLQRAELTRELSVIGNLVKFLNFNLET